MEKEESELQYETQPKYRLFAKRFDAWTAAVALITLAGFGFRLARINQPMRLDESATFLWYASKSFGRLISDYSMPNNHIFHSILMFISIKLFGIKPWALRMPAFIAGTALIPLVYLVSRRLYDSHTGLLASALTASSSWCILFSTNARGYMITSVLFLVMFLFIMRALRSGAIFDAVAAGIAGALSLYTIPAMAFAIAAGGSWLILSTWSDRKNIPVKRLVLVMTVMGVVAAVGTVIFYAPVIRHQGLKAITANRYVRSLDAGVMLERLPGYMKKIPSVLHGGWPRFSGPILAAGLVLSLVFNSRLSKFKIPLLAAALPAVFLLLAAKRVLPYQRVFLFLVPVYYMHAASGIRMILDLPPVRSFRPAGLLWRISSIFAGLILGLGVLAGESVLKNPETGTVRDAEHIVKLAAQISTPGDHLVIFPSIMREIFTYYARLHHYPSSYLSNSPHQVKRLLILDSDSHLDLKSLLEHVKRKKPGKLMIRILYPGIYSHSRFIMIS